MFETILFDLDGTLTPSLDYWLNAWHYALALYGRELSDEAIIRQCFNRPYQAVAQDLVLGSGTDLAQKVQAGLATAYTKARLFPQVQAVLDACKQAGLSMAIVSSSFQNQVTAALELFKLSAYFPVVISGEAVTNHKPHPEPLLLALSRLNKPLTRTLFVGDSLVDMLAGRAAGVQTALFLPPQHARFHDFAALRATEPDFIFEDYTRLADYLGL